MKIYLYIFTNTDETSEEEGFAYIGVANNLKNRINDHFCSDSLIGNKLRKHKFYFEILEEVDSYEEAYELEKHYISEFNTLKPNGYNLTKGGQGVGLALVGKKHSPEAIEKMKTSRKKLYEDPTERAKLSAAHKGKKHSAEHRANNSAAKIDKKHSAEHNVSIGNSLRGIPHSMEHTLKAAASHRGKRYTPWSTKKNHADISGENNPMYGKHHSPETIAKMKSSAKKRKVSKK